ncbi:MAG: ParA family protein [Magnetococcales bacterium]|nr:ParA family protein [Magnetococcales bacterium]
MKTIVLAARKGGVGKTTLTANLAVLASGYKGPDSEIEDLEVAILTQDPQKGIDMWWNVREKHWPHFIKLNTNLVPVTMLRMLRDKGMKYTFIDTPPGYTRVVESAMRLADLVVIPVQPSMADLWAAFDTVDAAKRIGVDYVLVINKASPGTSIAKEAAEELSQSNHYLWPPVFQRVGNAAAFGRGLATVEHSPFSAASEELFQLWIAVHARLHGKRILGHPRGSVWKGPFTVAEWKRSFTHDG